MYIERLYYKNVGPISDLQINFRKNDFGAPVPVVVVGQNGSGKSILLSNIVDAFYELADRHYQNATQSDGRSGHQYYKAIMPAQIRIGANYLLSHIVFQQDTKNIEYVFKAGSLSFENAKTVIAPALDWKEEKNYKAVTADKKDIPSMFEDSIVCFFGPNRYSKPDWMGAKYDVPNEIGTYSSDARITNRLANAITASNISEETLQWLFDVITDSRADLRKNSAGQYKIEFPNPAVLDLLSIARANVESIMSQILGEPVIFRMQNRSKGKGRLAICRPNGTILVPSLDALSTGQLALFNMFATIIRYADHEDIDKSHRLNEIKGLVVIDEIELHLHSHLQREVLPKLISLFPNVQFLITSHSPLFLLGMNEQFGEDNFDVLEMPSGTKISVEQFSEFEAAYRYLSETNKYKNEIHSIIDTSSDTPLIITEGSTDWKHMKAAYTALLTDDRCSTWLPDLKFDFLEYEPENSQEENCLKLKMSGSELQTMCEQYGLITQPRKMIFIADCDVPTVKKTLGGTDRFVKWNDTVFSLCLPIPAHRMSTPQISIEHFYQDEEIKRHIVFPDGTTRRIFMGNEFDKEGFSVGEDRYYCKNKECCGPDRIDVIDGSSKKKVIKPWDEENKNYALSKMTFATYVLEGKVPFEKIDFSAFIPLFEIIRDILSLQP